MSRLPEIDPKIYEGKNFDERVKIRKELIQKYGTSLSGQEHEGKSILGLKNVKKDASGKNLPAKGDLKAFDNLKFDERVKLRQQMIQAYGSSLPDEDEEKPKLKKSNGTSGGAIQSFEERCKKRKIILDILSNPGISHDKKKDILQNKEEYISDPNIFVQADGDIKYITESNERKRVTHDYDPVSNYLISQTDDFKGSWGSCLARAKQLKEQSKYPVMYVPWDEEKQWFKTESLNEIEAVRNVIGESSFKPVTFFLSLFRF